MAKKIEKSKPINLKAQIGLNIRTIREAGGLSREQLAGKAKVSARYIYVLEAGNRNTSIDTLEAIAVALGSSVCDIICTPERPSSSRQDSIELAIEILTEQLQKPTKAKKRDKD